MWPILAAVAAVLLVGVGVVIGILLNRPATVTVTTDSTTLDDIAASIAALPACTDIFHDSQAIDETTVLNGCKADNGDITLATYHSCADGRRLFVPEGHGGGPRGYGFSGGPFTPVTGDLAADRGYAAAYNECMGNS